MRIPICKLKFFFQEAEVKVFMMLRTMCRGQKGKILRQYIIKSPFISLFCNEGRRQCCCYFFSLFVENVATSKKQEKNCSRISFFLYNYFYGKVRPSFVQTKDPWELKRLFLVWWIFKILWGTYNSISIHRVLLWRKIFNTLLFPPTLFRALKFLQNTYCKAVIFKFPNFSYDSASYVKIYINCFNEMN